MPKSLKLCLQQPSRTQTTQKNSTTTKKTTLKTHHQHKQTQNKSNNKKKDVINKKHNKNSKLWSAKSMEHGAPQSLVLCFRFSETLRG